MTGVGVCLPQLGRGLSADLVRSFCEKAEDLGFTSLWVQEHMMVPTQPETGYAGIPNVPIPQPYRSVLAPLELLAAAAAWTSRARLGTSILVGGYHRPVALAQRLATLDVLAGGRLVVGLGVGWSSEEHAQMDVEMAVRGRRMDDLVGALRACWSPDPVSYEGEFFSIPSCHLGPKPVQQPGPPLIAGMWSERGLERTARLFDGWNPTTGSPADAAATVARMNAMRPQGHQPLTVWFRVFHQAPLGGPSSVEQVLEQVRSAAAQGFDEVLIDCNFNEQMTDPDRWLSVLDDLAPAAAAAGG